MFVHSAELPTNNRIYLILLKVNRSVKKNRRFSSAILVLFVFVISVFQATHEVNIVPFWVFCLELDPVDKGKTEQFRVSGIHVHDNVIADCTGWAGICFGGYDKDRGLTEAQWDSLIASGQAFSAECGKDIYIYASKEFGENMREAKLR